MAGIGEASAILGAAHVGLVFAAKLADFIGDYKDAGSLIKSLSDEIRATSTPLQQLGELAEKNDLYNAKFASDAQSLSQRCSKTIAEMKSILKMDHLSLDPALASQETELTRLERLKWALQSKSRLEIPRAELGRLKVEMTLHYVTLMTMKAQSKEERNRFAYDIPGVAKELRWASAQCEEVWRRQAEASNADGLGDAGQEPGRHSQRYLATDFDTVGLEGYRNYLEKQKAEQREKLLQQELALRAKEEAEKRSEEERRREEIVEDAIQEYKSQIREQEEKAEQERNQFESGIQRLLIKVGVAEDKIQQVLKEAEPLTTATTLFDSSTEGPIDAKSDPSQEATRSASVEPKSLFSRIFRRPRHAPSENVATASLNYLNPGRSHEPTKGDHNSLKAWVINYSTNTLRCAPIAGEVLSQLLIAQQTRGNRKPLLERFALLDAAYQSCIDRLCQDTSSKSPHGWVLVYLNEVRERKKVRRWKPTKGFTHVQVVLKKRGDHSGLTIEVTEDSDSSVDSRVSSLASHRLGQRSQVPCKSRLGRELHQTPKSEKDDCSKAPPMAEVHKYHDGDLGPKTGWTEIFKAAIDTQAVRELGYDFTEKNNKIVVNMVLSRAELDKLYERTKHIREGDAATGGGYKMLNSGPLVLSRHRNWNIPKSGSADIDDPALRGRGMNDEVIEYRQPRRRMISQPGDSGFIYRARSSSPMGKEMVKYGYSEIVQTDQPAQTDEYEQSQPRSRKSELAGSFSKATIRSQSAQSRRGVTFLNERTESPYEYIDRGRKAQRPSSRSVQQGLRGSARRSPQGTSHRYLQSPRGSRPMRRASSDEELELERNRPLSWERSRTLSYPPPDENGGNRIEIESKTSRHDYPARADTSDEEIIIRRGRMGFGSSGRSFSYTRPSGEAGACLTSLDRRTALPAKVHDVKEIGDEPYVQYRELSRLQNLRHRIDRSEVGVEDFELERARSPSKAVRDEPWLFHKGWRTGEVADFDIHASDAKIIEQQLARYRDGRDPASVALETVRTEPEDTQQRSDGQKLYPSPGGMSPGPKSVAVLREGGTLMDKARDRTVESSAPHLAATRPDSCRRASL